jgi:hypothetical protein
MASERFLLRLRDAVFSHAQQLSITSSTGAGSGT